MDTKMTMKSVKEQNQNVISIPYCGAHNLLHGSERIGYTSGTYGWNADVYRIDIDTVLVTGYRPFGNIHPDYELIKRYDEKAREFLDQNRWSTDYEFVNREIHEMLHEFVDEAIEEVKI